MSFLKQLGFGLQKKASFIIPGDLGTAVGATRTMELNDAEQAALKKHYDIASDANLTARNIGRGIAGDLGGGVIGGALGASLGRLGGAKGQIAGAILGSGLGMGVGTKLMTNKYSKANAQRILQKIKKEGE